MNSRRSKIVSLAPLALAAAGLAWLGSPTRALADGITPNATGSAYFRLTTATDIAAPADDATGPQVIATVLPPGSVVPPTQPDGTEISPLTILNTSEGFDQNKLIVALKDVAPDDTQGTGASQLFGLSFFGSGFKADGGHLDFALSVDNALSNPPVLQSLTPGISIASIPDPTAPPVTPPVTNSGGSNAPQVPEPASVALWSAGLGLGLLRVRARRRQASASA